ncbi:30S ribosomal protein S3 [Candidatus Bathyarchaeota archaeon]|nr:30S ribosomal protein S3 [Candidatus Bathyarchaeota archaeon]
MSVVKRIIKDNKERMRVDEFLSEEFEEAGYGGITLTKTPLGAQINLYTMRPGRVIGKRGRAIKEASDKLENQLGLTNPQITVVEIEVPELNPQIMAARVANALERGVHFRRSIFWSLRRIMDSGALGCEIILRGPLRSARAKFEKVSEGYIPKAGDPSKKYLRHATIHVKQKRGVLGVTVNIVPPDAKFPDKISLDNLPEIQYPEEIEEIIEKDIKETVIKETVPEETLEKQNETINKDENINSEKNTEEV